MGKCSVVPAADGTLVCIELIADLRPGIVLQVSVRQDQALIHVGHSVYDSLDLSLQLQQLIQLLIDPVFIFPDFL